MQWARGESWNHLLLRALNVLCRREVSGSGSRSRSYNQNMSASSTCDDYDKCPKPKDRCAKRDHCGDPPKETERKEKKKDKKKKFVYKKIHVTFFRFCSTM